MAARQNGTFELTLQPGYPKYKGESGNESYVYLYKTSDLDLAELEAFGADCPAKATLKLSSIETEFLPDGVGGVITYTYKSPDLIRGEGSEEIEYRNEELDVPLENHASYKKKWNHTLLAQNDISAIPSWWDTAVAGHVPTEKAADKPSYLWGKPGDTPPDGYMLLKQPTKPGVESFKAYVPKVTMSKRCGSKSSAISHAQNDGTRQTPPETFGYTGSWLQAGSAIKRDGAFWVEERTFIGSKTIDSDIYQ